MKLLLTCRRCLHDAGPSAPPNAPIRIADVAELQDLRDDNVYDVVCPNAHHSLVYLAHPKFEILFDMGAMAFLDGYYREAVATWGASLERFYEFYLRVIWRARGLGIPETDAAWKPLAKQSERQLGAFCSAHLLHVGNAANLLGDQKMSSVKRTCTEFRNDIIHSGKIPSRGEAQEYGSLVLAYLFTHLRQLVHTNAQVIAGLLDQTAQRAMSPKRPPVDDLVPVTRHTIETIVRLAHMNDPTFATRTLDQELSRLAEVRHLRYPTDIGLPTPTEASASNPIEPGVAAS